MKILFAKSRHTVIAFIDFFHKPVQRWIPTQTFRYLACGGSNTVLNWLIYHFAFINLLHGADVPLFGGHIIHADVLSFVISFSISFPIGFILSRHIVFPESNLHGRVQLFRYALATASLILITYLLIKFFAFALPMVRADISYVFVQLVSAILSYISQRVFTFKTVDAPEDATAANVQVEEEVMAE